MKFMKVALIVFVDQHDRVMLNKRRNTENTEMWDLIGGGVKEAETPLEAIIREIKEELLYDINPMNLRPVGKYQMETAKYHAEVSFFISPAPSLKEFTSGDEVFVEDLKFMPVGVAKVKPLLPMAQLFFDMDLLDN
ncbi:MAG: NUDIX hydrolase [Candidatus Saccharimonas sp.]